MMCNHDNTNNEAEAVTEAQPPTVAEFEALKNKIALRDADIASLRDRLHGLIDVIHDLPWNDINTGNFNPQRGCGEVKNVIDALISAGCDEDILMEGLKREFIASFKVMVTGFYRVEAIDEDDAEEMANEMLENDYVSFSEAENPEIESWNSVDWHIEAD